MNKHLNYIENLVVLLTKKADVNKLQTMSNIEDLLKQFKDKDDWNKFYNICNRQRVDTCVYYNLSSLEKEGLRVNIPGDIIYRFKRNFNISLRYENTYDKEVKILASIFKTNNIKVVFLKGLSYKKLLYKITGYRFFGDTDLLVSNNDLSVVNNLLKESGYITKFFDFDGEYVPDNLVENFFKIMPYNVMDYIKYRDDDLTLYLDLHKASDLNIYNSLDLYNNAKFNEDNYYELDIIDLFIYTCYHARHHYGFDYSILSLSDLPKLKLYMDIRELLLKITKNNMIEVLKERVVDINSQYVVNEMIKLTELIYDEQYCIIPKVTETKSLMNHNSNKSDFYSLFEYRMFRTENEKQRIENYIKTLKSKNSQNVKKIGYRCKRVKNGEMFKENPFWNDHIEYITKKDCIWVGSYNLYGTSTASHNGIYSKISFAWDNSYLYLKWVMNDKSFNFGSDSSFNAIQNQLICIFVDNTRKMSVYVQPKYNGDNKIFLKTNSDVFAKEAEDYDILIADKNNDGYELRLKISWSDIQFSTQIDKNIDFYFNVYVGDDKLEEPTILYDDESSDVLSLLE